MQKECPKHGLTKFNRCNDGGYIRHRCAKCQVEAVSSRRRDLKTMAVEYKGGACMDCGYCTEQGALEFHHVDPAEKEFAIGGAGKTRSFEKMKVELDKCLLLCANCHREEHARLDAGMYSISPMGPARIDMFYLLAVNS